MKIRDGIQIPSQPQQSRWFSPPPAVVKINIDAAIFKGKNAIGIGVIIKDERANVIAAKSLKIEGENEVLRAEILVTREGLHLALDLEVKSILLEGESRAVFEDFENSFWNLSYNGVLLHKL